jgi:hypothetical protein
MQGMSATESVVPHSPLSPTLQRGKMHHIWRSDIVDTADLKKTTCFLISFYSCIQYMRFLKIALHALLESEKEHNNHQRDKHYSLWLQLCKHSHWKIIHIWSHIQSQKQNAITTPASFTASGWPLSALCISGITLCKKHQTLTVKVSNYLSPKLSPKKFLNLKEAEGRERRCHTCKHSWAMHTRSPFHSFSINSVKWNVAGLTNIDSSTPLYAGAIQAIQTPNLIILSAHRSRKHNFSGDCLNRVYGSSFFNHSLSPVFF